MKTIRVMTCILALLSLSAGRAEEKPQTASPWDAYWTESRIREYSRFSDPQRRWAWAFLTKQSFRGNERVLDIGSADGRTAADLSQLLRKGSVTGIDLSSAMVRWATKKYPSPDYPNLRFLPGNVASLPVTDRFDLVLSFYTLPFSQDPVKDLIEIKQHLKPQGKLLISVPAEGNPAFKQAMADMKASEKWKSYFGTSSTRMRQWSKEDHLQLLKKAGLKVLRLERVESQDPFISKEEFIGWVNLILPPSFREDSARQAFSSELIDRYVTLRKDAIDSNGVYYGHFNHFEIETAME